MTKKEFSKTVKIYRSHKLRNNFISVTYANVLNPTTVSVSRTVHIEDMGGALTSLYENKLPGILEWSSQETSKF